MIHKLDFLVRFWELRSRHAAQGIPLAPTEQVELLSLLQMVTSDLEVPEPAELSKTKDALSVDLAGGGAILPAELRWVGAGALLLTCYGKKQAGDEVVLHATDAIACVEYNLPCRVLWVYEGRPASIALAVEGSPTRVQFGETTQVRLSQVPGALQKASG